MNTDFLIKVECLYCHKSFDIKSEYAGKTGRCKYCGNEIVFPICDSSVTTNNISQNENSYQLCPFCGEQIQFGALKCKHCGEFLVKTGSQNDVKQAALIGAILCLIIGISICAFNPNLLFPFYIPVLLAAFILSIIAIAQNRIAGGIIILLLTLILPPCAAVMHFTYLAFFLKPSEVSSVDYPDNPQQPENTEQVDRPIIRDDGQSQSNKIVITDEDQGQLTYLANFAEAYYAEAERVRSNIQEGNASGNRIFEERAKEFESKANDAKKSWFDIQNKYFPDWTERKKEHAWRDAIGEARNSRIAIEQMTELQQKAADVTKYQEVQQQRQIQRAIETDMKIGREQARKSQLERERALFNEQQLMKQEEIRRRTGR